MLWLAQRRLRGFPRWREEVVHEGGLLAAQGLDAVRQVRVVATARTSAHPLQEHGLDSSGNPAEDMDDTTKNNGANDQKESARHWATFTHYGA